MTDKKLLTPGPLTTSYATKKAMLNDWGSRDKKFIDLNQSICESLVTLINGEKEFTIIDMIPSVYALTETSIFIREIIGRVYYNLKL